MKNKYSVNYLENSDFYTYFHLVESSKNVVLFLEVWEFNLRKKLIAAFLLVASLILILTVLAFTQIMKQSLSERAFRQLESVKALKKSKIVQFLDTTDQRTKFLVAKIIPPGTDLNRIEWFQNFEAMIGRHSLWKDILDVFVVQKNGDSFNLIYSLSKKRSLPPAIRVQFVQNRESKYYEFLNDETRDSPLTLWIPVRVSPDLRESEKDLYLIFLFSTESIQNILLERSGLGLSGESYLVGTQDYLLRTHSRFYTPRDSVMKLKITTKPMLQAAQGASGNQIAPDYRGVSVLSSFDTIQFKGLQWAILSEIDENEIILPLKKVYRAFTFASIFGLILAFGVSSEIARRISIHEEKIKNLRKLSLYQGQESERERVSKELHDSIGQHLAAGLLKIDTFQVSDNERKELRTLIKDTLVEIKRISHDLAPRVLDSFGLIPAIEQLCETSNQAGITRFCFGFDQVLKNSRFSKTVEVNLFRVVQEAAQNIYQHSQATECKVNLSLKAKKVPKLILTISDNGIGLKKQFLRANQHQVEVRGLKNMKERVEALGGVFLVQSSETGGTYICAKVPIHESKNEQKS